MGRMLSRLVLAMAVLALLPGRADALAFGPAAAAVQVDVLVEGPDGLTVERAAARDEPGAQALIGQLRRRADVVAADVAVELELLAEPLRPEQYALDRLRAEQAFTITRGAGTVVAVVDSGVDGTHPDLQGALLPGLDLIDPSGNGQADAQGHGTAVAGVLAARENGVGIAGLAPQTAVLPVRVTANDGTASSEDVAEGVIWATDQGADVINISLGGPFPNAVLEQSLAYATQNGAVVVAAAGNSGDQGNPVNYPAAYPTAIAVGATDRADQPAFFSSSGDYLDLAAPGVEIVVPTLGGGYGFADGTSFSAPYVSAAAALVRSESPGLPPAEVAAVLEGTAADLAAAGRDPLTGAGLVQPVPALTSLAPPPSGSAVQRVGTDADPVLTAVDVSRSAFPGDQTADLAVLGRDDVFADSLAGAALAGDDGPVLFTAGGPDGRLRAEAAGELARALAPGATVYLLGGTLALSAETEQQVRDLGFTVVRLAGGDRYETALAVGAAVDPQPGQVLLARGDEFADALTGGAYAANAGVPVLLTPPDRLLPAVEAVLARSRPEVVLLGGRLALSEDVEAAAARLGPTVRVAGNDRVETAVAIARTLWGRTEGRPGDTFVAVDGFSPTSFAPALSAAVLSALRDAPQLLLDGRTDRTPAATAAYLAELGYSGGKPASAILVGPGLDGGQTGEISAALGG